jgi:hypothetical protein
MRGPREIRALMATLVFWLVVCGLLVFFVASGGA